MLTRFSVALIAAVGVFGPSAYADTLLYNCPCTAGSGGSTGTFGTEEAVETFTVSQTGLYVNALGAYDNGGTPLAADVKVGLYNDTTGAVTIAATSFSGLSAAAGQSFALYNLNTPVALINGDTYSVEAWALAQDFTMVYSPNGSADTFNSGGYSISNTPVGTPGSYLSNIDSNTDAVVQVLGSPSYNRYNGTGVVSYDNFSGGTLLVGTTPLPAALPLFATGLGALGLFGWRKKRKHAAALVAA